MKRTHQEVDEFLKESKEYIRDFFMGKKDVEIPENFLRKSFESTAQNINKYVPDLVNTKWIPDMENEIVEPKQKRIKLNHGTARVDVNCSQKTIDALNEIADRAYDIDSSSENEN